MIYDFHNDILTHNAGNKQKYQSVCNQLRQSKGIVLALWTSKTQLTIKQVCHILQPYLGLQAQNENLHFSMEDINLATCDASQIVDLPFLYYGIVHNNTNIYAGSCNSNLGLTPLGVRLAKKIVQSGKIVDVAHMSVQCFFDVIDACQGRNIVCSHTCFDGVHRHRRNLNDEQCKIIVQNGGLVGLTLVQEFLGGDSIQCVTKHIDYFVQKFGADNLSIGTDFFGTKHLRCLQDYDKFEDLKINLSKLGYSYVQIDKIFFENLGAYLHERQQHIQQSIDR